MAMRAAWRFSTADEGERGRLAACVCDRVLGQIIGFGPGEFAVRDLPGGLLAVELWAGLPGHIHAEVKAICKQLDESWNS